MENLTLRQWLLHSHIGDKGRFGRLYLESEYRKKYLIKMLDTYI